MPVSDLARLLREMKPSAVEGEFYFASVPESNLMYLANYLSYVTDVFREEEGLSVVFDGEVLDIMKEISESDPVGPFAQITLAVDSDLMAVGFLAKVTEALAAAKISANAFSAFHHDHIFVPFEKKDAALEALEKLGNHS